MIASLFLILCTIADRALKWFSITHCTDQALPLFPGLQLTCILNRGMSLSILHSTQHRLFVLISILVVGIILIVIHRAWQEYKAQRSAIGLLFILAKRG